MITIRTRYQIHRRFLDAIKYGLCILSQNLLLLGDFPNKTGDIYIVLPRG